MSDTTDLSRRKFLQYTGVVTGAAALVGPAVTLAAQEQPAPSAGAGQAGAGHHTGKDAPRTRGRMFFTNDLEFFTLTEAAERIFPEDETGPGAKALAVPFFIDNQLAGAYGYNAREYMSGPHFAGAPTQGYQAPLLRRDIFKQGLLALNEAAKGQYGKTFPELQGAEQDAILSRCEAGDIPLEGVSSALFFALLRDAVLAGAYSDPIYNGNNNMDGWRMKHYPGAQMSYAYLIDSPTFENVSPLSLADMQ